MDEFDRIIEEVKDFLRTHKDREEISEFLQSLGFELWANAWDFRNKPNPDEEFWAYDKGTPNGQLIILINWIDGFAWFYKKVSRCDIGD